MDNLQACGTSRIAGCRFSLYPMTDDFVEVILSALKEVDTSKVWKQTDDVSTCIRGRISHIFDVTKAIFLHAAKTGKHVVMSGTFSIGCPGDSEGDVYLVENDIRLNTEKSAVITQPAACQFALYPMGDGSYMDVIYREVQKIKDQGVDVTSIHYATRLDGDTHAIFTGLENCFTNVEKSGVSHVVMTFTISANSPSAMKGAK
ncbi:MAG TPA: Ykof family thiamine-binding protein [Bacillus sp. (in: firmicutes)]|uniref:Ykof family thiamine-binding protein n=1 Tax=Bacillus litorisediminis TaxID=2922713 RepID=UPI001FAD03B2|nr:Ykof family thiamine-binding protein [Bacillus litorisediminis]HWO75774.1 Ykof family thiamine-binding protein [Bacillus sp. (in: firmicutes)]